jgi:superfamily II DNA/RNA helicase
MSAMTLFDPPAPPVPRIRDGGLLATRLARKHQGLITGHFVLPGREGAYADLPEALPERLAAALRTRGVSQLYAHQRAAWDAAQRGEHLVVATPTASGKSLCYTLPVVAAAMTQQAKALYLFPTKALRQDQVAELIELNRAGDLGLRAATFDGDTPGDQRQAIRLNGDIVVSNPDMLHQGILPHHTKWAQFFEGLQYVVIDEIHSYRGVFGSHLANVLRRLRRVCAFYGASPQFILCSATIGNPKDHAEALLESDVTAITDSGAPTGDKHVLLWNPPVVNPDLGLRASARSQSNKIARTAIRSGLKTLVFAQSRTMVEVLTKYLKDVFDHDPRKPARIRAYRGGYLPTERRDAERAMREGRIDGIVSTSALELGVDIGSLDVVVLNGYPGSVAATWQRFGRAGPAAAGLGRRARREFRSARPVRRAPSRVLLERHARTGAHRRRPAGDPARPHPLRRLRTALPRRRTLRPGRSAGVPGAARAGWRRASGRRTLGVDRGQLSGQRGEPALRGRRQFRGRRPHRRAPGDHRGSRLLLRAADAVRRRDPHGPVHALPGRTPGLGGPQGLRHAHARGLLH